MVGNTSHAFPRLGLREGKGSGYRMDACMLPLLERFLAQAVSQKSAVLEMNSHSHTLSLPAYSPFFNSNVALCSINPNSSDFSHTASASPVVFFINFLFLPGRLNGSL